MTDMQAWAWIFANWGNPTWQPIPITVRNTLHLHLHLGVCNHCLVTQTGAKGMYESVKWLNRSR